MNDDSVFWIVWNPLRDNPQKRHRSELAARNEAARLCKKHMGEYFYVCEVTRAVHHPIADVTDYHLRKPEQDEDYLPF